MLLHKIGNMHGINKLQLIHTLQAAVFIIYQIEWKYPVIPEEYISCLYFQHVPPVSKQKSRRAIIAKLSGLKHLWLTFISYEINRYTRLTV